MKKLMFTAAVAALCATVGLGESITSANIVGYMENGLVDGFKAAAVPFNSVGKIVDEKKGVNLSDVIPDGAETILGTVTLQKLNSTGGKDGSVYAYHKNDMTVVRGKTPYATDGWYNGTTRIVPATSADIFIPMGSGVWVKGASTLKFVSSGEVQLDTTHDSLVEGFRLVSNPYATDVKLSAFVPGGVETVLGTVTLQKLDSTGSKDGSVYAYHKNDMTVVRGKTPYATDGWYNGTTRIVPDSTADIVIAAGTAVWVKGAADVTIDVVTPFEDL